MKCGTYWRRGLILSIPLPAGPARVLSEASYFSKSIYFSSLALRGSRYGSKGEEDCFKTSFS